MPLIAQLLRTFRAKKGLSRSRLSRLTVAVDDIGVSEATIKAIEREAGRVPEARVIEALARALDVEPQRFYEYPIAVARRDARAPGRDVLEESVQQLTEIDPAESAKPVAPPAARAAKGRRDQAG